MTIRTLVVDDDFRVAELHRLYTEEVRGFVVVGVARTGAEALDLAARLRPDLVLLDIYLPDISGIDVLRHLREQRRPVDVIAITAARDIATLRAVLHGGSIHYLIKPFTFEAFRERLESYAVVAARLDQLTEASQTEVDHLYRLLHAGHDVALPKGLSVATRDAILGVLGGMSGPASAVDVARAAGISRVTARRYLEHLVESGRVDLSLAYGAPGRPEHRYRLRGPD